jgi:xanthine dehydrogenase YagS FAD-binding subunit
MREIRYLQVAAEGPAIAAVEGQPDAAFVAGGTSLVDLMKLEVLDFAELVDINPIPLTKIEVGKDGARIGAMVRNSDLARHPEIVARYPLLSEALLAGASPQIRNMATVGGNLLQRTRCYYYRDPATACNKRKPGSGCDAIPGFNRNHAILGTSEHCIATHPSDMCVALAALDAVVHTRGPAGERDIPLTDLHRLPGDHPEIESVLGHGELVVAVSLPAVTGFRQSRYLKVRDRASYAFALSAVAAALQLDGNVIRAARIALGGVATKPWRASEAERVIVGKPANAATFAIAADEAVRGAKTRPYNAFKVELTRRAIVRALSTIRGAS